MAPDRTPLELFNTHLAALKAAPPGELHAHLPEALRHARFIPRAERCETVDAFVRSAEESLATAPHLLAAALFTQAMDRFINEELEASLPILMRARARFAERNDSEGLGLCAVLTGAIYRTFGNYDLALKVLWEGHELLKASGRYPIFLAANANSMANIDLELGHLDEAQAMFTLAWEESSRADDFYFMVYGLHGLGRVYLKQGKREEATQEFTRALELSERHANPLQISNSLTELATVAFTAGELAEAERLSTRALEIREKHHLLAGAVTNCLRLAEIRCHRGDWKLALPMLDRALAIAEELKFKPKLAQVHHLLAEAWEKIGDSSKSLSHFRKFHELSEQVQREDSARKLTDAKLIFEAEQTRKENAVIRAQKEEILTKNVELQDTIDELTRAKIGRKAKAMTLALALVLFVFQDAILRTVLRLMPDNYWLLLGVKMAIIFSLAPVNRGIENYLLRRVREKREPPRS